MMLDSSYTATRDTDHLPATGCSLADYAKAKRLPLEFLETCGITEYRRRVPKAGDVTEEIPYLAMRYYSPTGALVGVRYRDSLSGGKRFRWRSGDTPFLYGAIELPEIRRQGFCFLVEGESDTHTLRYHGFPVLGLPGNNCWNEQAFAPLFEGIDPIYVVIEPGESGAGMLRWIAKSAIRHRVYQVRLEPYKDINELHIAVGGDADEFNNALGLFADRSQRWGVMQFERLSDLMRREIPPLRWIVDDYIPEGLTLLVGTPKIGKSWLCLAITEACASGGMVLGQQARACESFYFALEDNDRRLQDRGRLLYGDGSHRPYPDGVHVKFASDTPTMRAGFMDHLALSLDNHPNVGVVLIDTLAYIRDQQKVSQGVYEFDVEALRPLHTMAAERRIAIIVVTHVRKSPGEMLEIVSGSYGLTGTADTIIVMTKEKEPHTARFRTTGRDLLQQHDKLIRLDGGRWHIEGDYKPPGAEDMTALRIQDYLRREGPARLVSIMDHIGEPRDSINKRLTKLVASGLAWQPRRGVYALRGTDEEPVDC